MIDRFGLLPAAAKTLFSVAELKLRARELGIQKIEVGATGGRILFTPTPNIDPVKIILLIQQPAGKYRLDGPDKLRFQQSFEGPEQKFVYLDELLSTLAA
jgi:transcription-repair coupling factor (superfamily II helicase)